MVGREGPEKWTGLGSREVGVTRSSSFIGKDIKSRPERVGDKAKPSPEPRLSISWVYGPSLSTLRPELAGHPLDHWVFRTSWSKRHCSRDN